MESEGIHPVALVCLVYLVVWFVLFVWLNKIHQVNKTNQMNQINRRQSLGYPVWLFSSCLTLIWLPIAGWFRFEIPLHSA
jgi:hypothetical protein